MADTEYIKSINDKPVCDEEARAKIEDVAAKAVQADWNENDPESPAYVKNRIGGYTTQHTDEVVLEEMTTPGDGTYWSNATFLFPIVEGGVYTVTIDGVTYTETAQEFAGGAWGIGNPDLWNDDEYDGESTPFAVGRYTGSGSGYIRVEPRDTVHTVSVTGTLAIDTKLDEKWVPDTIARAKELVCKHGYKVLSKTEYKITLSDVGESKVKATPDYVGLTRVGALESLFDIAAKEGGSTYFSCTELLEEISRGSGNVDETEVRQNAKPSLVGIGVYAKDGTLLDYDEGLRVTSDYTDYDATLIRGYIIPTNLLGLNTFQARKIINYIAGDNITIGRDGTISTTGLATTAELEEVSTTLEETTATADNARLLVSRKPTCVKYNPTEHYMYYNSQEPNALSGTAVQVAYLLKYTCADEKERPFIITDVSNTGELEARCPVEDGVITLRGKFKTLLDKTIELTETLEPYGTTYTAGEGITISGEGVVSAKRTVEEWTFTLDSGDTVKKKVVLSND